VLHGFQNGNSGVYAEQFTALRATLGKGDNTQGFACGWVGHWAPPANAWVLRVRTCNVDSSKTLIRLAPNVRELPRSFPGEWVAAVRRLETGTIGKPGRPEGLPRTAAITRRDWHKKAPAVVMNGGAYAPIVPQVSRPGRWICSDNSRIA